MKTVVGENSSPSTQPARRRTQIALGVVALLAVLLLQLALSANRNSITWDEDDHIYAGYMSWKDGDFGLNPEHPPLVKLVAASKSVKNVTAMRARSSCAARIPGCSGNVRDGRRVHRAGLSIGHSQKAQWLLDANRLPEALGEAQQAVALAPEAVKPNAVLGDILTAMQHPGEARVYYQKALTLAQTVEPAFQIGAVEDLKKKLALNSKDAKTEQLP